MTFQELTARALDVRAKYSKLEIDQFGREWTGEELMLGYIKDVGDLAKLLQVKAGVRETDDVDKKLAHELSDCLWSVIILADKYGVDLESAFVQTMGELDKRLDAKS